MNIKRPKSENIVNLNESQQEMQLNPQKIGVEVNTDLEEIVLKTKSKQFEFDCGIIMANINVPIKNRFGLKWHFENSTSQEEFIESVKKFIEVSGNPVTENDISMLKKIYARQISKQ